MTVCLDMETFTKKEIPDWLRERLEKRLRKENLDGKYGIQYTKIVCIRDLLWKQIFSVSQSTYIVLYGKAVGYD